MLFNKLIHKFLYRSFSLLGIIATCLFLSWQNPSLISAKRADIKVEIQEVKAWEKKADSLQNEGEHEAAIALFQKAMTFHKKKELWRDFIACNNFIAYSYYHLQDSANIIKYADQAIRSGLQYISPYDTLIGHAYNRKAEFYMGLGDVEKSLDNFKRAGEIYKESEAWYDYVFTQIGTSVNYYVAGQISQMETPLNEAEKYALKYLTTDSEVNPIIFHWRTVLYDENGDFDKALAVAFQGLDFLTLETESSTGIDSSLLANSYNNIGALYHIKGDLDAALEYYTQAISIQKKYPDFKLDLARAYANMAIIYIIKDAPEKALPLLQKSNQSLTDVTSLETQYLQDYLNYYNHSIEANIDLRNYEQAGLLVDKALGIFEKKDLPFKGLIYSFQGEIQLALNNFGEAIEALKKGQLLLRSQKKNAVRELSSNYRLTGETYLKKKELEKALENFEISKRLLLPEANNTNDFRKWAANSPFKPDLIHILKEEGKTQRLQFHSSKDKSHLLESLSTFQNAIELQNQLLNEYLVDGSKQFLLKVTSEILDEAILTSLDLFEYTKDSKYLEQAFAFAEKSKAILLAERLQDSEAKTHAEIPDSVLQLEESLKRDLSFYQKKIYDETQQEKPDSLKNTVWQEKVFSLKRALEKYEADLEKQYPEYYAMKNRSATISLAEVQKSIGEGDLFLEYFVGENQIYLFQISQNDLEVHTLEKPANFEQEVMNFRNQLVRPATGNQKEAYTQFEAVANQLGQLLLTPALESENEAKRLVIIPDEILHFIPFELLLTEAKKSGNFANASYLIKTHTVNYSYSAALLLNKKESSSGNSFRCLAFAPSYDEGAEPIAMSGSISRLRGENVALPGAQREVKALSNYFRGDFYFGEEASEQTFKAQAKDYQLIHLAMHGSAEQENPMYSKLYFTKDTVQAEDDTLFAYELYDMNLTADLVVLSACETGHGKFVQGEGVMSLASAFIHAGVPSVTMSLWEAQDEATAMIMENYYQNLSNGQAKDGALRAAKLAYLTKSGTQKHPFYWSAFVNIGNAEALRVGRNWYDWMKWGAVAFLGMFGLFFARRLWH